VFGVGVCDERESSVESLLSDDIRDMQNSSLTNDPFHRETTNSPNHTHTHTLINMLEQDVELPN